MIFPGKYGSFSLVPILVPVFYLICCTTSVQSLSVMSVDFGSEWMKIAIVSPGVPMEIALNKESKRKTPIAIAFRDGERTFGEDALAVGVRFPKNCYGYLLDLIGKKFDNPMVKIFQERFPYYTLVPDPERGTVVFQHDEKTQYSVDELVAMILHKAKEIAQNSAGQTINEAVLTVPGFFNQAERKAMIQAAELAGIKVLQLINDYTAAALNYGIFRRKDFNETANYIMLYDMGASTTTATVIGYQLVKTKEKGIVETNPQLQVLGVGYDRSLGGLEMTLRLRDHLAKKFNELKKTSKDVFKNPRSMAKLFKEAERVKTVLSANADHFAQIEGLIDEIDFRVQVTREEFENLCTDLFDRVQNPVEKALAASSLTMDVISQVILVGAGTRVPAVQGKLAKYLRSELGKSLNTDEAAVLGAVYKAADLSTGFKVKKFITKDAVIFPVQVTFDREAESGTKTVKRMLFGPMNPFPQKKILTFNKHQADFEFQVSYDLESFSKDEVQALGESVLEKVSLTGVAEAIGKHQGPNADSKGIKAHFSMDDSGLLGLVNVELVVEKNTTDDAPSEESPLSKLGSTISKLFSGPEESLKENLSEAQTPEDSEEAKKDEKKEENKTKEESKTDSKKPAEPKKPKIVTVKEEIATKEESLIVPTMKGEQLEETLRKIEELNHIDEMKFKRESALNALESFVFEAKSKLETDEYKNSATDEERSGILELCSKLAEWLDEDGWEANVETLEEKIGQLRKLTKPVWGRVKEHQERPEALAALKHTLNASRTFLVTVKNMTAHTVEEGNPVFTQVEMDTLSKAIDDTAEWIQRNTEEQSKTKLSENPVMRVKDIMDKVAFLDREVKYLVNKAKIWKPKIKEPLKTSESNFTAGDNKTDGEKVIEVVAEEEGPEGEESPKIVEGAEEKKEGSDADVPPELEEPEPTTTKKVPEDIHTEL